MPKSNIFISYSHRDVGWKDRLVTHLSALQDAIIEPWDDTRLQGGDTWLREIDEAMEHARIAILLVSADFLVSNFIRSYEVPRLLERRATDGLRIYPLIVRECPWRRVPWLGRFQARPLNATPLASLPDHLIDSALSSVAEEVQDLLAIPSLPLLPPPGTIVPSTSPYRPPVLIGLRVFPSEPLRLEFVLTPGEEHLNSIVVNQVAVDLISYFLACLTLPEENLWVNLSPEKLEKIIPSDLGSTRMGQILIRQDYVLKQFSASLMFPETDIGRGDAYFPQLDQWRPPLMPRPKITDGRRERSWSEHEIKVILGELFAPKREGELTQAAIARYQVGRKVQFSLLSGLRHSEMNLIPKTGINWDARQVRVRQGKTGNYKVIGPLGQPSMGILREFFETSKTDLVFSRTGNITPKFYQILREACQLAGVPHGRSTPDGLVLHDARYTATTYLLESGVSPKTIQEWMGWSDKAFVLYYSHATKRSREQAGRSLERLAGHIPQST